MKNPKILLFDIETAPMEAYIWKMFDQNIPLEMITQHSTVLSWAAQWYGDTDDKIIYKDNRNKKNVRNDKQLCKGIHELLDEADIVVTQNGVSFDSKKLNGRFVEHDLGPTAPYRHIDVYREVKKHFAFDSNKLAHLSAKLAPAHQKSEHKKFPGFSLWKGCLNGNIDAWNEMQEYNPQDIISLKYVFEKILPWIKTINFNVYHNGYENICSCGSTTLQKRGYTHSNNGKYQRFQCQSCGKWMASKKNFLEKEKRDSLLK